jgi:hypothetical protein
MAEIEQRHVGETATGDMEQALDGEVTLKQAGARSITARNVDIRQGGAVRVQAREVEVMQGGVVFASTQALDVVSGGVMAAIAERVELRQSGAQLLLARESVNLDQAAGGLVVSKTASARDSVIGVVLARQLHGEGIRVLMGSRAAFAFGAGLGVAFACLRILRRWR